jgi:hypothetical protein
MWSSTPLFPQHLRIPPGLLTPASYTEIKLEKSDMITGFRPMEHAALLELSSSMQLQNYELSRRGDEVTMNLMFFANWPPSAGPLPAPEDAKTAAIAAMTMRYIAATLERACSPDHHGLRRQRNEAILNAQAAGEVADVAIAHLQEVSSENTALHEQVDQLQAQLHELRERYATLRTKHDACRKERFQLRSQLAVIPGPDRLSNEGKVESGFQLWAAANLDETGVIRSAARIGWRNACIWLGALKPEQQVATTAFVRSAGPQP